MIGYFAPGATVETDVEGFASGLVGTLGATVLKSDDTVAIARTTTGITEPASGVYHLKLTAPTTAGTYQVIVDDGTANRAADTFIVSSSAGSGSSPTGIDLCTLADVKTAMELTDASLDLVIPDAITAVSRAILDVTGREIAPATASAARRFRVTATYVDLSPYDLRTATAVVLDPDAQAVTLNAHTDYELLPTGGDRDGVYTAVRISDFVSLMSTKMLAFGFADVSITGAWGYASVPPAVKRACIVAVRSWMRRDLATYAQLDPGMRETQPQPYATYKLPAATIALVQPYMRFPEGMAL